MVAFSRLFALRMPLLVCATTGLLWTQLNPINNFDEQQWKSTISRAELICQAFKEKQGIPGVSVGVTVHGSLIWKAGLGLADIEQRVPCTADTVMRIASISKAFTTTIAARLVESGKLAWDDTIAKHHPDLPGFSFENVPVTITVRQLASHTSGIRHYWKKGEPITDDEFLLPEYYLTRAFPTVNDALSLFLADELLYRPGTSWEYTTHGFTLLSAVLERAAGQNKTFVGLVQDLIVNQLGLKHTRLEHPDELVPHRSRYYCRQNLKDGLRNVAYVDLSYKWAGGGMLSNVTDLLIFGNTLLQCRQTKSFNHHQSSSQRFLRADTVREMWSAMAKTKKKSTSYGLGWMVVEEQRSSVDELTIPAHVYHTGGAVGATSILLIIPCSNHDQCLNPRCGICVTILANLQRTGDIYQTALEIAQLFRQKSRCSTENNIHN